MKTILLLAMLSISAFAQEKRTPIAINETNDLSHVLVSIHVSSKKQIAVTTGGESLVFIDERGNRVAALRELDERNLTKPVFVTPLANDLLAVTMRENFMVVDYTGKVLSQKQLTRGKALYIAPIVVDSTHVLVFSDWGSPFTGRGFVYANVFEMNGAAIGKQRSKDLGEFALSYQTPTLTKDGQVLLVNNKKFLSYDWRKKKLKTIFENPESGNVNAIAEAGDGALIASTTDGQVCVFRPNVQSCKKSPYAYILGARGTIQTSDGGVIINMQEAVVKYMPDGSSSWTVATLPTLIDDLANIDGKIVATSDSFTVRDNPGNQHNNAVVIGMDGKVLSTINSVGGVIPPAAKYDDSTMVLAGSDGKIHFVELP